MRREVADHTYTSSFVSKVRVCVGVFSLGSTFMLFNGAVLLLLPREYLQLREAEVGVWSPDSQHRLAYKLSWRDVIPARRNDHLYLCASSAEYDCAVTSSRHCSWLETR